MKARNAPDATPGAISGKVTRRNVITPPAPRLCEASSSAGSSCVSDAVVVRSTNGTHTITWPSTRNVRLGEKPIRLMKTSAAKPNASAGNSSGDMNSTSAARTHFDALRAIASEAAVPSTTEMIVVQNATIRLAQAARCIWSASSSAQYQRSDNPLGGKRSDSDAVNEVRMTTMVGPIRNTIAIAASTQNTMRSDSASISTAVLGAAIGLAPPPDPIQHANDHQHGNHENNGECRREWPVIGADRLLVDVQGHV